MKNEIVKFDLTKIKKKNGIAKKGDYVIITKIKLGEYTGFLGRIKVINKEEIILTCVRNGYWGGEITDIHINRKDETFKLEFSEKEEFLKTFTEIKKQNLEKIKDEIKNIEDRKKYLEEFDKNTFNVMSDDFLKEQKQSSSNDLEDLPF